MRGEEEETGEDGIRKGERKMSKFAIVGITECLDSENYQEFLGTDFEPKNLKKVKEELQKIAKQKDTQIGGFSSERSSDYWYVMFSEYVSVELPDSYPYPGYTVFECGDIKLDFQIIEQDGDASITAGKTPKGRIVGEVVQIGEEFVYQAI